MNDVKRIGIYAGTFDPVHSGHITFALQAIESAKLDAIYFLPERRPRQKKHVEHFAHRVAMLKKAARPHPQFKVLELVDTSFTIDKTLPKLNQLFKGSQLYFLLGSDVFKHLAYWPNIDSLLSGYELIIGLRHGDTKASVEAALDNLPLSPIARIIDSYLPDISSSDIRQALRRRQQMTGSLKSVERYSNQHWLYVSLSA